MILLLSVTFGLIYRGARILRRRLRGRPVSENWLAAVVAHVHDQISGIESISLWIVPAEGFSEEAIEAFEEERRQQMIEVAE